MTNARGDRIRYNCTSSCRFNYKCKGINGKEVSLMITIGETGVNSAIGATQATYGEKYRPSSVGTGSWKKKQDAIKDLGKRIGDVFDVVDFGVFTTEVWYNVYENCKDKASDLKIVWDATVDMLVLGTNMYVSNYMTAAVIGMASTPLGAAVGVVAVFGLSYLLECVGDEARKEAKGWVK